MFPGSSREIEKLIVCEYGVRSRSSIPAVIAKPPASSPDGKVAGKVPKPDGCSRSDAGMLVRPVNRGVFVADCTPAGLVTDDDRPNDRVPLSALVARAPPMRS